MSSNELLRLASADNFRDVAGQDDGHLTRDGGRVRLGAFYRSNQLSLEPHEVDSIADLRLRAVHDLRRQDEVDSHPSVEIPGASWHHHDVVGPIEDDVAFAGTDEVVTLMERTYRDFVLSAQARTAFGTLLGHLATDPLPQLFHCTAGKDRTGWAAALLLLHAGVPEEVVMADYLASNDFTEGSRARYQKEIAEALGEEAVEVLAPFLTVREQYLALALRLVDEEYGDLDGYLRRGLGLDDATLTALRERLVG